MSLKKAAVFIIVFIMSFNIIVSLSFKDPDPYSRYSGLPLNTYILENYNIISYGEPFGDISKPDNPDLGWLKIDTGKMTKKNNANEKGEYKYLGYNYEEEAITNDHWFRDKSHIGSLFNEDYSNINAWRKHPNNEALKSWTNLDMMPELKDYILTTEFWDEDHVSKNERSTGYTIQSFCQQKNLNYWEYALVMTVPTADTSGSVKFLYGNNFHNTVIIPPLPHVKCVMTATPNINKIPAGKTEDIVVTIDTTQSTAEFKGVPAEISNRYYWASLSNPTGSGQPSTSAVYQITVPDVSPNSIIKVKAEVFSQEIEDYHIPGSVSRDSAEAEIFIGEMAPPAVGAEVAYQLTSPNTTTVIKADQRDNERFDVSMGIPSGENLYTNILTEEYLYRLYIREVSGSVDYTVTVNHQDAEGNPDSSTVNVSRDFSFWEIASLEVYAVTGASISNGALPSGRISLTPSNAYRVPNVDVYHDDNDLFSYHVITGGTSLSVSSSAVTADEVRAVAEAAVSSPTVRNDRLSINGKVIMAENGFNDANLNPAITSRNALYASGLTIPDSVRNSTFTSTGNITYQRIYALNPKGSSQMTFPLSNINSVSVHTPVYIDASVSSDDSHNQKPEPMQNASAVILGRPFNVSLSNTGAHRSIQGFGTRDYTAYVKDRQIRFGFDTYFGNNMGGVYLKANTWKSLESLGIANNVSTITFYTPTWVDEGSYTVEVRSLASNDTSNGSSVENQANINPTRYAANVSKQVEVSGRVYDFKITDVDDLSWELFFRLYKGKPDSTGKKFFTGPNNINGDADATRQYVLPVMPGKNVVKGYSDKAVKLGYAIKFELNTMGNYYDSLDFVRIMPTFYFVDKTGKNRMEVDLYYSTAAKPLVKVGSPDDTLTQSMKLNFTYRGINLTEFSKTAEAMFKLRGSIKDFTLENWITTFPKISQNGVTVSKYFKILLSEPIRSFVGPDKGIPVGVDPNKALASVQKWYGEYYLPADCLAVPKGTDLSKQKNLTRSSPVFLKDGYIIVSFKDIAVINNDNFDHPSLQYTGRTADGWQLEAYNPNQNSWELQYGDVVVYYADQRSTDDSTSTGTH